MVCWREVIPFLNNNLSLAKQAFVVAQFIAPLIFSTEVRIQYLIMRYSLLEMVLYQINVIIIIFDKVSIARHGDLALQIGLIWY